ncbi:hypothetical protein LSAT2_028817 [Lamellibrachia satsuma]|nr:hypothetical protein LSAT2_028817 [Lamellibrachia satsuma]
MSSNRDVITSKLMLPARKSFAVELRGAQSATNNTAIASLNTWTVATKGCPMHVSIVWLQGVIVQNSSDESFLLDDGTAVVRILKPPALPGASTKALPGMYVMVVGELVEVGIVPTVRVMKMQDLSNDAMAEAFWSLEVIDLHQNM